MTVLLPGKNKREGKGKEGTSKFHSHQPAAFLGQLRDWRLQVVVLGVCLMPRPSPES